MRGNKRAFLAAGLLLSLVAEAVSAEDHLASPSAVQEQLTTAARGREQRIALIDGLLDTPQAARVSKASGIGFPEVKRQVALLSDADLRDLAVRAEALNRDPVAGDAGSDWVLATLLAILLAPVLARLAMGLLSSTY